VGEALDPNEVLSEVLPAAAEVLLVPVPLTAPLALPLTAAWLLIGGLMALMPEVIEAEPEGDIAAETGLVGREEDGAGALDCAARSLLTWALCTGVWGDLTPWGYILLSWNAWQYLMAVV
jgi:hypothetical protein